MSLAKYLDDNKIDQIQDDQKFMEAEYNAIQAYCEDCGYLITHSDLETIESRGLGESFIDWKEVYIKELWADLGKVSMSLETEEIARAWRHFPQGTHREDIWYWFEETFNVSVAELMGQ